jgi:peptidoglycan/LPS O-acetylase OafA/YrhL
MLFGVALANIMTVNGQRAASPISQPMSLFLDIVRFGAACAVLLHHAAFEKFGTYLPWRLTLTDIEPVIAFFVLSGFVIAYTADENDGSAGDYSLSRMTRLLSVTVPAVVLTVVLDAVGSAIAPKLYADHWADPMTLANLQVPLIWQVSLTTSFLNEIWWLNVWPGTNSPFWSLGYEAPYYVLFGMAYYLEQRWLRLVALIAFSLFIGPKILMLLPIWLLGVLGWHLYKRLAIGSALGTILCGTAIFLYVAFLYSGGRSALDEISLSWLASVAPNDFGLSARFLSAMVSGVLFAVIIVGFKGLERVFSPLLNRFSSGIRVAAGCTFSMYLYHYPLIYFFRACALALGGYDDLTKRNVVMTSIVLIDTVISIYCLAMFTERKKNAVRRLLVLILGFGRLLSLRADSGVSHTIAKK